MIHSKKSQSILQWFNSLTTKGDVNSLTQFTDGSHFYEIVASQQPVFSSGIMESNLSSEPVMFNETSIACNEEVTTSVEEEVPEGKISVSESRNSYSFVIKESNDTDTHTKYDVIRKFIDNFYHVNSSSLIDYGECQNGKELELAKVAVFLLSAMVQNLLFSEDKVVYNATLLELEVQENICECLSLVLMEKDTGKNQLKKIELHKILSHPASYKGIPIRKQLSRSSLDTNELSEGVKNVSKKLRKRTSVIVYEDVQDSPLKNHLDLLQYKAALFKKDSELVKLRSAVCIEENKVMDLSGERNYLKDELGKKRKEIQFYKKEIESELEGYCEKIGLRSKKFEKKKLKEGRIQPQEIEVKELKENNEALQEKAREMECKETKYGRVPKDISGDLNSTKHKKDKLGSSYDNKIAGQCNPSEGKMESERSTLLKIVQELEKKNCLPPRHVKKLSKSCSKISDACTLSACLRDMAHSLEEKPVQRSITTRSCSLAEEENVNSLVNEKRYLENELKIVKQNYKLLQNKMGNDLKVVLDEKTKEIEKLQEERAILQAKYIKMTKLTEKKDEDVSKAIEKFHRVQPSVSDSTLANRSIQSENRVQSKCSKKDGFDDSDDSNDSDSLLVNKHKHAEFVPKKPSGAAPKVSGKKRNNPPPKQL